MTYDPQGVRAYFDAFAGREWDRLETTVQGRNLYAVHRRFLVEHVTAGKRVLDIGSGPGRFAIDLVSLGAEVTVADLSPVQLELARERLAERGLLDRVTEFRQLDVTSLASIGDAAFDAVVCYGGVLSYTREHHTQALGELARVLRPGGVVLLSVMSLYGTLRLIGPLDAASVVETIDQHLDWEAVLSGADVVYTRVGSTEFHQPIALFTSVGLRAALAGAGFGVEVIASSNPIVPQFLSIPKVTASTVALGEVQRLELAVCDHPGLVDAGGHLIAVARRAPLF